MIHWFKSSYSGGDNNCVEVARVPTRPWHKASHSAERGACVEIAEGPVTGVRDTQHRELGALFFTSAEWQAFIDTTKGA
ncbi:DUF397 domain-containing protein [Nocardiopsis sp. RV163]|uniref:DUF397 domain-containing protein n=1 Tax=Nocardiopsis sp. RV163 TaxID=1661388 RepID=UPI0009E46438|nr:DUF397 domain-containing protein [Nocardiopsis sp. RV163]